MANAPEQVQLFEVNLISDQISTLLRRRAMQQVSGIATVLMIVMGTVLALLMAMHLGTALRMRTGTQIKMREFEDLKKICADLDTQREAATQRESALAPLLPIARQRVAWAPKLAAIAASLPPNTGIVSIQASQRDVFVPRAPGGAKPSNLQDEAGLPQMAVAVLCAPSGDVEDNLSSFADRLKKNEAFMDKFDSVHLVAMEQDNWENKPAYVLHLRALGTGK